MILKTEMKDFVKKVLILGILLSIFINLLVTWASETKSGVTNASSNDTTFKRLNNSSLGITGLAVSLNVGTKNKLASITPVTLTNEVLPISYILSNKAISRDKIITSNMIGLSEYLNVLKTDVNSMLNQSSDREAMLESFLDQIKYRYSNTLSNITILKEQARQLESVVSDSTIKMNNYKNDLTTAYKKLDYDKTQSTLDNYLQEKDKYTYANTYLVFLNKFISSYQILNEYNKVFLDTLINNKEALIKNVTVVIPDSGTNLLKKFDLVKTEAEFKSTLSK